MQWKKVAQSAMTLAKIMTRLSIFFFHQSYKKTAAGKHRPFHSEKIPKHVKVIRKYGFLKVQLMSNLVCSMICSGLGWHACLPFTHVINLYFLFIALVFVIFAF